MASGTGWRSSEAGGRKSSPLEGAERPTKRRRKSTKVDDIPTTTHTHDVDGHMIQGDVDLVGMDVLVRSRISAARAMGLVMASIPASHVATYDTCVMAGLTSGFASTQLAAAMVIDEYATNCMVANQAARFIEPLQKIIDQDRPSHYRDLVSYVQRVRSQSGLLRHRLEQQQRG